MLKKVYLIIVLLLSCCICFCDFIRVNSNFLYLGSLSQGQIQRGEYAVSENIVSVMGDCDCLTLKKKGNKVAYRFDTTKYTGRVTRIVYVTTKKTTYQLKLVSDILPQGD